MSSRNDWRGRRISRRGFLGASGVGAAGLLLGASGRGRIAEAHHRSAGFGPLVPDPGGMLDLPRGFQYRVISREGEKLSDGRMVPGDFDGMAAYRGAGGATVLVRNHEVSQRDPATEAVPGRNPYDPAGPGGTTAVVVGRDRRELQDYVTSSGTSNNCAGGATPWGTWITCEEDRSTNHGYVFEVMPGEPENDLSKTPIRAMGYFSHEAIDIDPGASFDGYRGVAYLTEDDFRGRIPADPNEEVPGPTGAPGVTRASFLYRYLPANTAQRPGALQDGGTLQVLAIQDRPNYNVDLANPRQRFGVAWLTVNPEEPHEDAIAKGGARFNRLEGAHFEGGALWFDDTAGGEKRLGQMFRYLPSSNTLELFYEGTSANEMESPDNVYITPWGDVWFAEDGAGENRLMGITPEGGVYKFASNRLNNSELAGPCFSLDGRTAFVNIQSPGHTFAIWGPFQRRNPGRQREMALAAPPAHLAPRVSGELAEAAQRLGMSDLEAAAYDRLGVPVLG